MLYRPGLQDEPRREAVQGLAQARQQTGAGALCSMPFSAHRRQEDSRRAERRVRSRSSAYWTKRAELTAARAELEKLATSARQPIFRQIGFVSLVNIDGSVDRPGSWPNSVDSLRDFVSAMPLIADAGVRASLYPKIEPLLKSLPADLAAGGQKHGPVGRYVRIELPRRGTLTLAEVEVTSGGKNVARQGKASQKDTAFGGEASRASMVIRTATTAKADKPTPGKTPCPGGNSIWATICRSSPLSSTTVPTANFAKRLDGSRSACWIATAKKCSPSSDCGTGPEQDDCAGNRRSSDCRAAGGHERTDLYPRAGVQDVSIHRSIHASEQDRPAAIRALQRIPKHVWPKEEADRWSTDAGLCPQDSDEGPHHAGCPRRIGVCPRARVALPPADAKKVRGELGELGVRVVRIGTLPERMATTRKCSSCRPASRSSSFSKTST